VGFLEKYDLQSFFILSLSDRGRETQNSKEAMEINYGRLEFEKI